MGKDSEQKKRKKQGQTVYRRSEVIGKEEKRQTTKIAIRQTEEYINNKTNKYAKRTTGKRIMVCKILHKFSLVYEDDI